MDRAIRLAEQASERIDSVVVKLGLVPEHTLAAIYGDLLDRPVLKPENYPDQKSPTLDLPLRYMRHARVLPLSEQAGELRTAMANPFDDQAIRALQFATGLRVVPFAAVPAELEAAMDRLYGDRQAGEPSLDTDGDEIGENNLDRLKDLASEAPVIRLVNQVITRAARSKAEKQSAFRRYNVGSIPAAAKAGGNAVAATPISYVGKHARLLTGVGGER